jgi:hypothetical protein
MENTTATADKSIVEQLDFDAKTSRRVGWETWEFSIAGPHQVEVTNAAYGFLKDEHSYVVGIKKRGGILVPAECECPADVHREPDCKHKVALATMGGPIVLNAAINYEPTAAGFSLSSPDGVTTAADKLETDGGTVAVTDDSDACPNGDGRCDGPDGDELPCFECFELTEEC